MTVPVQENQEQPKQNDKEFNFRAIEAKFQQERMARLEAEKKADEALKIVQEMKSKTNHSDDHDDDHDDSEPYVDKKKLNKTLAKFGEQSRHQTKEDIEKAVHYALQEERKKTWMNQNPDFYEIMQHAEKFAEKDPDLAESILQMPEGFERQKLVYKNIKALGLHKPVVKESHIQEKIDSNRRSPYYQPSNIGSAPYNSVGDFSPSGQKNAYAQMKDRIAKLRI